MSADADLLILGGGIAGLTTALAAAERQLSVIVIDSPRPGAASSTPSATEAGSFDCGSDMTSPRKTRSANVPGEIRNALSTIAGRKLFLTVALIAGIRRC